MQWRKISICGLTAYTGVNPETIYQGYEFRYFDVIYPDRTITELFNFPSEIVQVLKCFKQGPIFVKFHTIPLEKDEETGIPYPRISIIQVGYIS